MSKKKKIGIITIHRIYNYGSVLQAYALQVTISKLGFAVEIIDYLYPNNFHRKHSADKNLNTYTEDFKGKLCRLFFKAIFILQLLKQHRNISKFIKHYLNLSFNQFRSPSELENNLQLYDVYVTGSDQIWNPRYTNGDTSFFFGFLSNVKKVAYSSSFGLSDIPEQYKEKYGEYLRDFSHISVREKSGIHIVRDLSGKEAKLVLDPTLLLSPSVWNEIALPPKYKCKYILCYFLNYTFNAFPYVDDLAEFISKETGFPLIHVARPPQKLINKNSFFKVDASPGEFLGLVANAELVLTTSFHGTAFAINYNKPVYAVVQNRMAKDSRLIDLMQAVGLSSRILYMEDAFPRKEDLFEMPSFVVKRLNLLREDSLNYLSTSL